MDGLFGNCPSGCGPLAMWHSLGDSQYENSRCECQVCGYKTPMIIEKRTAKYHLVRVGENSYSVALIGDGEQPSVSDGLNAIDGHEE